MESLKRIHCHAAMYSSNYKSDLAHSVQTKYSQKRTERNVHTELENKTGNRTL